MSKRKDGGPAFPQNDLSGYGMGPSESNNGGMSLRDWFAAHAPTPSSDDIAQQMIYDKARNPYNEGLKPKLREAREIIADLAYDYADAMLKAREVE